MADETTPLTAPKRRFEIRLTVSGDDWPTTMRELSQLVDHVDDHGPECTSVSGSPASGHIVTVHHDASQTHERYHEQLRAYLAAKCAARANDHA